MHFSFFYVNNLWFHQSCIVKCEIRGLWNCCPFSRKSSFFAGLQILCFKLKQLWSYVFMKIREIDYVKKLKRLYRLVEGNNQTMNPNHYKQTMYIIFFSLVFILLNTQCFSYLVDLTYAQKFEKICQTMNYLHSFIQNCCLQFWYGVLHKKHRKKLILESCGAFGKQLDLSLEKLNVYSAKPLTTKQV